MKRPVKMGRRRKREAASTAGSGEGSVDGMEGRRDEMKKEKERKEVREKRGGWRSREERRLV